MIEHPRDMAAPKVTALLNHLARDRDVAASTFDATKWLMASLLYGSGLRLRECLKLRVKTSISNTGRFSYATGSGQEIA